MLAEHGKWLAGKGGKRANLCGTDLSGANLSSADMRNSDLTDAVLLGTCLVGAILSDANLSGTDIFLAHMGDMNTIPAPAITGI